MISQHKRFIAAKHQLILEKEEELEAARLRYLAERDRIISRFNERTLKHSSSAFKPEIIHGLK